MTDKRSCKKYLSVPKVWVSKPNRHLYLRKPPEISTDVRSRCFLNKRLPLRNFLFKIHDDSFLLLIFNQMSKFPYLIIATAILAGCAAPPPVQSTLATRTYSPYSAPTETVSIPALNVVSSVEVGQSIVSTAKRTVIPAIELEQDVVHSGKNLGSQFVLNIPKGKLIHRGSTEGGKFYQADKELNFVVGASTAKVKGGVFIPDDKALPTEIFWLAPSTNRPLNDAHPGIKYEATVIEQWGADSFKRELVYSGVSQNTISILYREFQNDMARPAFSQELKYDLSQGKAIGYKGARFEVTKANNIGLEYKVLKTLD